MIVKKKSEKIDEWKKGVNRFKVRILNFMLSFKQTRLFFFISLPRSWTNRYDQIAPKKYCPKLWKTKNLQVFRQLLACKKFNFWTCKWPTNLIKFSFLTTSTLPVSQPQTNASLSLFICRIRQIRSNLRAKFTVQKVTDRAYLPRHACAQGIAYSTVQSLDTNEETESALNTRAILIVLLVVRQWGAVFELDTASIQLGIRGGYA